MAKGASVYSKAVPLRHSVTKSTEVGTTAADTGRFGTLSNSEAEH